jgi:hypothetical protein
LGIDRVVPLAPDLPEARVLIERRPAIVTRYHELPPEPHSDHLMSSLRFSLFTE